MKKTEFTGGQQQATQRKWRCELAVGRARQASRHSTDSRLPESPGDAGNCGNLRGPAASPPPPFPGGEEVPRDQSGARSDLEQGLSAGVWAALLDAPEAGTSMLWLKLSVCPGESPVSTCHVGMWVRLCPMARPLPCPSHQDKVRPADRQCHALCQSLLTSRASTVGPLLAVC